jgi:hypothetical protein
LNRDPRVKWPEGIEPIGMEDLNRIGIDSERQLYWDGHRIEIKRFLVLTRFQKWFAAIATVIGLLAGLATIATGFNNASIFLCARHISVLSCPVP